MNKTKTIVHITPHLGGGVGTSLSNFINQSETLEVSNQVFCLDWCEDLKEDLRFEFNLAQGMFWGSHEPLNIGVLNCDCVLIHYWNHPLLTVFLSEFSLPKNKSIFWCHNSGIAEPHIIPKYLTEIASKIVFTSQSSVHSPNFESMSHELGNLPLVVPTVRDLQAYIGVGAHRSFRSSNLKLLYVGSVTRSKMHPDASVIFAELSKRGCQIKIIGGPDHDQFAEEVESLGGNVEVFGQVDNVIEFYRSSDLFLYPLRSDHYGTGEQVILEALASGLPVIAFNNPAEAAILDKFPNIKLARSTSDFLEIVSSLIDLPEDLFKLSREVNFIASSLYGSNRMTTDLLAVIKDVVDSAKSKKKSQIKREATNNLLAIYAQASFFDESIYRSILNYPDRGVEFIVSAIRKGLDYPGQIDKWQARTKSTPEHYRKYFPENLEMDRLAKELIDWRA